MYCPRCATENNEEQKFCRRCGLSLAGAQLALAGRAEGALPLVEKARATVHWLIGILGLALVTFVANVPPTAIEGSPLLIAVALTALALLAMLIVCAVRLSHARKLLDAQPTQAEARAADAANVVEGGAATNPQLPPAPAADPLADFRAPGSVTEGTTVKLEAPPKAARPRP